jgi:hypothetical protein
VVRHVPVCWGHTNALTLVKQFLEKENVQLLSRYYSVICDAQVVDAPN